MNKNSRILITGGKGFLGRHLHHALINDGYTNTTPVSSIDGDLTNVTLTQQLFKKYKPEIVFHLAAKVGGIGANMQNPAVFWYANTAMGLNVLECCRQYECKRVIIVGTCCSYPKYCQVPFKETDFWNGYPEETNAAYGIAKKNLITGALSYKQQYGLDVQCPILANLYGPGDSYDLNTNHVIPALIKKLSDAKQHNTSITLWGDGSPSRDFLHVSDCADALIHLAESNNIAHDIINIGSGVEMIIKELVNKISKIVDFNNEVLWDKSKPNGQPRRCLDITKMKTNGWSPKINIDDGLRLVYDDYMAKSLIMGN